LATVPIIERLRFATRELHAVVEEPFASLLSKQPALVDYERFLLTMSAFHGALGTGARADALAADRAYFGLSMPMRLCRSPRLPSFAAQLGAAYVVEGSALGARVLYRNLAPRLGLGPETGARFLFGEGDRTLAGWKTFVKELTTHVELHGGTDEIVAGAVETFACLAEYLAHNVPALSASETA
jgi:heme oxygenase